jgi:hypothetical protein
MFDQNVVLAGGLLWFYIDPKYRSAHSSLFAALEHQHYVTTATRFAQTRVTFSNNVNVDQWNMPQRHLVLQEKGIECLPFLPSNKVAIRMAQQLTALLSSVDFEQYQAHSDRAEEADPTACYPIFGEVMDHCSETQVELMMIATTGVQTTRTAW